MRERQKQWIGVDFDGTLAEYVPKQYPRLGDPIYPMLDRVASWLAQGLRVKILTARVGVCDIQSQTESDEQEKLIKAWCVHWLGRELEVTAQKDYFMVALWDDRAVAVESNTGRILGGEMRDM